MKKMLTSLLVGFALFFGSYSATEATDIQTQKACDGCIVFTKEAFAERLNDPKHTIYIAETDNGEVVGYAFAWIVSYRNHDTYIDFDCFYIDDICVLKSCQRNGIGRGLFERCKKKAQEAKCKMIDLGVWEFNRDAIAFYKNCGMTDRIRRMEYRLEDEK